MGFSGVGFLSIMRGLGVCLETGVDRTRGEREGGEWKIL